MRETTIAMVFGIVVGASASILIAAPILLVLGEGRLRPKRHPGDVGTQAPLTDAKIERMPAEGTSADRQSVAGIPSRS